MNETKKTYVKPAIEGVYLLPDEAVLGGCKMSDTQSAPSLERTGCETSNCVTDSTIS